MAKKTSPGLIAAALGGLGLVGYLALSPSTATAAPAKPKPGGSGGGGAPPPTPTPGGACQLDANLPNDLRAQFSAALNSTTLSPADYEGLAQDADMDYPMTAACLRQKGKAVKVQQQVNLDTLGGMPFTIRQGDIPYLLAQYYTGNPARFPDLATLNPKLGPLTTTNGVSNYPGWQVGVSILIPKSWDPLSKPIPPVATGGGAAPAPTPTGTIAGVNGDTSGQPNDAFSQFMNALQGVPPTGGA